MKASIHTVQGTAYEVWSDFIKRCTYAKNTVSGKTMIISNGNYIRNDLTVRKAIAIAFKIDSFRK